MKKIICRYCLKTVNFLSKECPFCKHSLSGSRNFHVPTEEEEEFFKNNPLKKDFPLFLNWPDDVFEKCKGLCLKNIVGKTNTEITNISVTNLFDYYNYNIDINEDLSIFIAPNGFGKTTILNIIYFLHNPSEDYFKRCVNSTPFSSFKITYRSGETIEIKKMKETNY